MLNEVHTSFSLTLSEIFNAEVVFREDCTSDEFIDVILGTRVYMPCLYVSIQTDRVGYSVIIRKILGGLGA